MVSPHSRANLDFGGVRGEKEYYPKLPVRSLWHGHLTALFAYVPFVNVKVCDLLERGHPFCIQKNVW